MAKPTIDIPNAALVGMNEPEAASLELKHWPGVATFKLVTSKILPVAGVSVAENW